MFRRPVCALGLLLSIIAPSAYAQYATSPATDRPVQWYVDGGLNVPARDTGKLLNTGWTFGSGAPLAPRADVSYETNKVTSHALYRASGATGTNISGGWIDTSNERLTYIPVEFGVRS